MTKISVERQNSPWKGMTASVEEESSSRQILLEKDISSYEIPGYLSKYKINGNSLLAINQNKKRVIVNAVYFKEIFKTSAVHFSSGQPIKIGIINIKQMADISFRSLTLFLIESEIIQTYIHLESRLCMENESSNSSEYLAKFRGEHIYFTNHKNVDPLSFAVRIDKKTGVIQLIPAEKL